MRRSLSLFAVLLFCSQAIANNENTTIVLHGEDEILPCEGPQQQGLDCELVMPTTDITGMSMPFVFIYLHNYDAVSVLQCAFDWPLSWTFMGGAWDCQHNQLTIQPTGPGPVNGTVVTAFDVIVGGVLAPIGRLIFSSPQDGCLDIIESAYPYGTHVVDPYSEVTPIPSENRGRICVGPGGYDACDVAATPVEDVTWGRIKGQYRRSL